MTSRLKLLVHIAFIWLLIFLSVVVGAFLYFCALVSSWEQFRTLGWQEVPCTIVLSNFEGFPPDIRPEATYKYQYGEKTYTGRHLMPDRYPGNFDSIRTAFCKELEACRIAGKSIVGYVNPRAPEESVLIRGGDCWRATLIWLCFAFLSPLSTGMLVLYTLRQLLQKWRAANFPIADRKKWHSRIEWIDGIIRVSDRYRGLLFLGTGIMGILLIPGCAIDAYLALTNKIPDTLAYAMFLFPLLHVSFLIFGGVLYMQWRRYGDSTLRLVTNPGVVGGPFTALLEIEEKLNVQEGVQARLYCLETVIDPSNSQRATKTIWERDQIITRELRSNEQFGTTIPILFSLPYEVHSTEESDPYLVREWHLAVKANVNGLIYSSKFEVPIFQTEASDPNYVPDKELFEEFVAANDSQLSIRASGIETEEIPPKGVRFVFSRSRNAITLVFVSLAILCGFGLMIGVLSHLRIPIVPYVAFFGGLVVAYCILDLFLHHSVAEVEPGRLTIRRGLFFLGSPKEFLGGQVLVFYTRTSLLALALQGNVSLFVRLPNGGAYLLAKRVGKKELAYGIIRRIAQVMYQTG